MALTQNFKVNQLAKDLGIKTKDVMELLAAHGVQAKTQSALEPDEFGMLFNLLTKANQIEGIDDYIDGITYIPSAKKVEKKKPELKAEEEKPEPVGAITVYLNSKRTVLEPNYNNSPHEFLELMALADIDISNPPASGNMILTLNGKDASFTQCSDS